MIINQGGCRKTGSDLEKKDKFKKEELILKKNDMSGMDSVSRLLVVSC